MSQERHPSALAFDALALGAVDVAERATLEAHLAGCERCRARQDAGAADRERFTRFVFPRTIDAVRATPAPLGWPRLVWLFAPAVVIAAVWIGLGWRDPRAGSQHRVEPSVPAAGPVLHDNLVRLQIFALEPSVDRAPPTVVRELVGEDKVKVGELLRFRLGAYTRPCYAALLVRSDGQAVLIGQDEDGQNSRLQPERHLELATTWLVEEGTTPARVFVLYSTERLPAEALRKMLTGLHLDAQVLRHTDRLELPATLDGVSLAGVTQRSRLLEVTP